MNLPFVLSRLTPTSGDLPFFIGAFFLVSGVGISWWGVLALRDGEKRPGIPCAIRGALLISASLSMLGVF